MIHLDLATILFLHMSVLLVGGGTFAYLQRNAAKQHALRWLSLAFFFSAAGVFAAALGEQSLLPAQAWEGASLWFGTMGHALLWIGLRALRHDRPPHRSRLALALPFFWVIYAAATDAIDRNIDRAAIFHLNAIIFMLAVSADLLVDKRKKTVSRILLLITIALYGLTYGAGLAMIVTGSFNGSHAAIEFFVQSPLYVAILLLVSIKVNERVAGVLKESALRDHLTGLGNRHYLFDALPLKPGQGAAVILFDLDHFKSINDRFGHGVGDQVLAMIGQTLKWHLREGDLCARYGGEEFIVIPKHSPSATIIADRLRKAISHSKIDVGIETIAVTASFGMAIQSVPLGTWEHLIDQADKALYEAKRQGRNRVCSYETMSVPSFS